MLRISIGLNRQSMTIQPIPSPAVSVEPLFITMPSSVATAEFMVRRMIPTVPNAGFPDARSGSGSSVFSGS